MKVPFSLRQMADVEGGSLRAMNLGSWNSLISGSWGIGRPINTWVFITVAKSGYAERVHLVCAR